MKEKCIVLCLLLLCARAAFPYPNIAALSNSDLNYAQLKKSVQNSSRTLLFFEYTLKKNDTLEEIARKTGTSLASLVTLNSLSAPLSYLPPVEAVLIPSKSGIYLATKPRFDIEYMLESTVEGNLAYLKPLLVRASYHSKNFYFYFLENKDWTDQVYRAWKVPNFRSPVLEGIISSHYGARKNPLSGNNSFHYGIDISSHAGDKIFAAGNGRVIEKDYNPVYGYYIEVEHSDGKRSLYGHILDSVPKVGDAVLIGEHIAYMGSTGMSTGAHIHFEIVVNNAQVDPMLHLNFRK